VGIIFVNPKLIAGTPNKDAEPPQIAVSGKSVYIIWHEHPTEALDDQADVFLARSTNRGDNFGGRDNLSNSPKVLSDGEQIAVSGRNVYVVWSENVDEILFRRSTDGGASFKPAKKLNTAGGAVNPQIAVSEKNVFVVWEANGQAGNTDIFFTQSSDKGLNFDQEKNISKNDGISQNPYIDLSGDKVIVTWRDASAPAVGGADIFFAQGK
jgi:hypothetical protein